MSSRSINKVVLLGNLTRDPELKYTPAGTAVCTFGIATNRSWTTADGQTKEEAQYHRVVAWQKLAELCGKLLTKGRKVYLDGRITYREYTDKTGQQRHITEIVLDDFIVFGDGKRTGSIERHGSQEEQSAQSNSTDTAREQPAEEKEQVSSDRSRPVTTNATDEEVPKKKEESEDVDPSDIPF